MTVPRGTVRSPERTSRVSARVPTDTSEGLNDRVADLRRRGLAATRTELVELALARLVDLSSDDLEEAVRSRRAEAEEVDR